MHNADQILSDDADPVAVAYVRVDGYGEAQALTGSIMRKHFEVIAPMVGHMDLLSHPEPDSILVLLRQGNEDEALQRVRLLRHLLRTTLFGSVDVSIGAVFLGHQPSQFDDVIRQSERLCNQAREKGNGSIVCGTFGRTNNGAV